MDALQEGLFLLNLDYQASTTAISPKFTIYKAFKRNAPFLAQDLSYIFNIYENDFAQSNKYGLNMRLLVKIRNLQDFFRESKQGMKFREKLISKWLMVEDYSYKARSQILLND